MTDDNPFGDLDDGNGDSDAEGPEADETESDIDPSADTTESRSDDVDPLQEPAFEYDKDIREYFYARPDTWGAFEDLVFDAQVQLRKEYDLRDVPKRELHDAAMRAFLEHADSAEIVENVVEARTEVDE